MTEEEYRSLLADSHEYVNARTDFFASELSLGSFDTRKYDLGRGRLFYLKGGKEGVEAEIQVVGSISFENQMWLWSWADPRFSEEVVEDLQIVRSFGEQNDVKLLTEETWEAEEADGWDMSAITAKLLQADGVFKCPDSRGSLFIISKNLRWIGLS
jgi:hypothetical protein